MSGFIRRSKRTVYENPWIRFEAYEIVHPSGHAGEHGLMWAPPAVAVVALDGVDVLLARQWRFAIDREIVEVVKGGGTPGESPQLGAQRELREELGFTANRWDDLGIAYELPAIVQPDVHLFLARDLTDVGHDQQTEESIVTVRMPFADALRACVDGRINDAITVLALVRTAALLE
jgi:8-oxo-dGTP pyrophosphatase MutT (NUDIX family)